MPKRRPRPRMQEFDYIGQYAYHIILLTHRRTPYLKHSGLAVECIEQLKETATKRLFRLLAYTMMPDHMHLLLLGDDESSDLIRFVQRFKQATAFKFKRETEQRLWQQSFYDRVLRADEDVSDIAQYILDNPVVAGLIEECTDYRWSGGEYFDALIENEVLRGRS